MRPIKLLAISCHPVMKFWEHYFTINADNKLPIRDATIFIVQEVLLFCQKTKKLTKHLKDCFKVWKYFWRLEKTSKSVQRDTLIKLKKSKVYPCFTNPHQDATEKHKWRKQRISITSEEKGISWLDGMLFSSRRIKRTKKRCWNDQIGKFQNWNP